MLMVVFEAGSQASEYRIEHCLRGCPQGVAANNHLILRPIYALSYNTSTRAADWAAYKVSAATIGIASSLSREPMADEFVAETLDASDFEGEDEDGLVLSRFVPLVNFAGTPYWNEVNFLTNIVARNSKLNQGAWYGLEWAIRNLANRENEVFIVTGPIYRDPQEVAQLHSNKPHRVPDAFFKIVMTQQGNWSAFLFNQNDPVYVHHCDLQTSVEQLESLTGLNFFPEAPALSEDSLASSLGCS
jgi:endonuclease G